MRLDPLPDDAWPAALAHLRGGFMGRANVYRVLAHHPALVEAWTGLRQHVVVENVLGPALSEVVILRLAHRLDVDYEWAHHVVRARSKGLTEARIGSLRGPTEDMEAEDALLARAVDALVDDARLPPALLQPLGQRLGKEGVLDLMATVGLYTILAFVLRSFATPLDDDIAAALERQPLEPDA